MTNKQERGAIMLEVLAVLALIGVMGPMLYRQVLSRNQEISNVNIAAEMRAIKEAMSSAIAADSAVLAELCGGATSSDLTLCSAGEDTFSAAVNDFLPIGMEHILDDGYGYAIKLYTYEVSLSNGEEYPIAVGVVVGGSDLAENWSFKRAARIANLIGTDGGVKQGDNLVGSGGSWQLDGIAGDFDENVVVATTAMDTFDPDLGATDPNAVTVPGSLAFADLHAWNYFSVGSGKGPTDSDRCFTLSRKVTDTGEGSGDATTADEIKHVGDENCDPLFWVGTKGDDNDKSIAGQVYVKNNLYIGRDNKGEKQAFAFEGQNTEGRESKDHDGNKVQNSRIVVYNIDGDDTLTIDATGKIVSDKTMNVGGTKDDAGNITGGTDYNYGLDVANTSVLNDVRLASRGGARLSDILPNYISKGIYQISSGEDNPYSYDVPKPNCPTNYAAAVIVTPLKWRSSPVQKITVPDKDVDVSALSAPAGGGSLTGTATVKGYELTSEITQDRPHFAIEIGDPIKDSNDRIVGTDSWTVTMGYKNKNYTDWDAVTLKEDEIQALAQTYCVYVPTDATYDPNALTDDQVDASGNALIPDNLKITKE